MTARSEEASSIWSTNRSHPYTPLLQPTSAGNFRRGSTALGLQGQGVGDQVGQARSVCQLHRWG
jgi:hypothetical protein